MLVEERLDNECHCSHYGSRPLTSHWQKSGDALSVTSRRTGNLLTHPPDTTVNGSVSHTWSNLTDSTLIDCFWSSTRFDFGYGSSRSTVSYNVNVLGVGIADNTTVQKTADEPFVRGISWKQQPARCDSAGDSGRDEHRR